MARLYSNENFPLPVVVRLRQLGHDVLTSADAGNANRSIPDEAVVAFAMEDRRCILTMNRRHFIKLHHQIPSHCGIIVCTRDIDFAGQAERIHAALPDAPAGKLIRINRPG